MEESEVSVGMQIIFLFGSLMQSGQGRLAYS